MSATPIPRTLALAIYGDLELSILDELPKGRQNIITRIITPARRDEMYEFIKKQIKKGRQAFVICPLIEEKDQIDYSSPDYWTKRQEGEVKAAVKEKEHLQKHIFPEFKIGLLHGKLKGKEKEEVMNDYKEKKLNILVSTSVVEVGVDIPNATVMLIEGAERFGLAQLHQFRGRVGRGKHQSYCFLSLSEGGVTANRRLKALISCNDGFKLAEKDLSIRGPGEFIGTRQSGLPDLTMASLSDTELIKTTRKAAQEILDNSPDLSKFLMLKKRLQAFKKKFHGE
jgi:ATP-dependent DNA helicase RecG